jgi:hypothetical protein
MTHRISRHCTVPHEALTVIPAWRSEVTHFTCGSERMLSAQPDHFPTRLDESARLGYYCPGAINRIGYFIKIMEQLTDIMWAR